MRTVFHIVGRVGTTGPRGDDADWVTDLPAIPRLGEIVDLPGIGPLNVRTIIWYPWGSPDPAGYLHEPRPYVYLVVGDPHP